MKTIKEGREQAGKIIAEIKKILPSELDSLKSEEEYNAIETFCDETLEYLVEVKEELAIVEEDDPEDEE